MPEPCLDPQGSSRGNTTGGTAEGRCRSQVYFLAYPAASTPALVLGYKRHASKDEPQYIIKSDKTDHLAIHKGSALKKIKKGKA
jgi:hypothetical protein